MITGNFFIMAMRIKRKGGFYVDGHDEPQTELYYEISSMLSWLHSMGTQDFVGTESRVSSLFQMKVKFPECSVDMEASLDDLPAFLHKYQTLNAKYQDTDALPTENEAAFFLEGLLRLCQVATYPSQLTRDRFRSCLSNKPAYLREQIPELIGKGHRIVVFSQFLGFLRSLADDLKTLEIRYSYVDGETQEREREIALFQSNLMIKVLLISLRVGGIGIDLTSSDVCILADPWWNDAVEKQAIDRLHRFGQKKQVKVLRLISADSVEEKMEVLK